MSKQVYWVTTKDNPYDYWTQFNEWYAYDTEKGYNTCAMLARFAKGYSDKLPEQDKERIIDQAIETLLRLNPTGLYIRTTPEVDDAEYSVAISNG